MSEVQTVAGNLSVTSRTWPRGKSHRAIANGLNNENGQDSRTVGQAMWEGLEGVANESERGPVTMAAWNWRN